MEDPRFEPQVAADTYWTREYNTKERFCSFWHQVDEALAFGARTVLEVGPGSGIVTELLTRAGVTVTTLDFDPAVGADVTGSITATDFEDSEFDVVLCGQVLEHLPWEHAQGAMREIARISRVGAVISVPDSTAYLGFSLPMYFGPYIDQVRMSLPGSRTALVREILRGRIRVRDFLFVRFIPTRWAFGGGALELDPPPVPDRPEPAVFDGQHYWEIGRVGYSTARVQRAVSEAGFDRVRTFRVPENPWHRFFVAARGTAPNRVSRRGERGAPADHE